MSQKPKLKEEVQEDKHHFSGILQLSSVVVLRADKIRAMGVCITDRNIMNFHRTNKAIECSIHNNLGMLEVL